MADILLGTANAEGFIPSGVRFYDALGYINHEGQVATVTIVGIVVNPSIGEVSFAGNSATVTLEQEIVLSQDQGAGSGRFSPFERDEEDILEIVKLFLKKVA